MDIRKMILDHGSSLKDELEALCARHDLTYALVGDPDFKQVALALHDHDFKIREGDELFVVFRGDFKLAFQDRPKEN